MEGDRETPSHKFSHVRKGVELNGAMLDCARTDLVIQHLTSRMSSQQDESSISCCNSLAAHSQLRLCCEVK